ELAGSPDAGLYLVEDQERARLIAEAARLLDEGRVGDVDAALALDDLEHNGAGLRSNRLAQRVDVVEGDGPEAGRHRGVRLGEFLLAGRGYGRHRSAVEGAGERDDLARAVEVL